MKKSKLSKKVLLLHSHPEGLGGIANFYMKLRKLYHNSTYNFIYSRSGRIHKIKLLKFFIFRFFDLIINYIRFSYKVFHHKPDIIHLNFSLDKKSVYREYVHMVLALAFNPGIKVLSHIHGWKDEIADNFRAKSLFNSIFRYMIHHSNEVIVLATGFKKKIVENFTVDPDRISVLPTLVDTKEIKTRINHAKPRGCITILFLSRIFKEKGIFEIVKSVEPIIKKNPGHSIKFVFAGEGVDRKNLENYASQLNVSKYIEFTGYIRGHEKIEVLLNSNIFIFPSYHDEGCPLAVLEAMGAGLPIVCTNIGALEDIIKDDINGLLVPRGSVEGIVEAVSRLIRDEELRKKMGENNREKAEKEFDVKLIFEKIEAIYNKLLA